MRPTSDSMFRAGAHQHVADLVDLGDDLFVQVDELVEFAVDRYNLTYTSGSLPRQVASAWKKVFRLSLPNGSRDMARELMEPSLAVRRVAAKVGIVSAA
jgi:NADPH-dependent stearoyl-CoA 9-desaturase